MTEVMDSLGGVNHKGVTGMPLTVIRHTLTGPLMDMVKVFMAGIIAFLIEYAYWVPDAIKFIILLSTCVYVVYKMMREIRRYYLGDDRSGKD
jgi:hypothetical protein